MERKVTKIPAKSEQVFAAAGGIEQKKLRRVGFYARVSTEQDEQEKSYEAQVKFYTEYIQNNPEWVFVGGYSDEGITGTNTKRRDGFNRMVADGLSGKLDLVLTKSVSRFARNTIDSLQTIRNLKEAGCELYFEKENIWTFDSKGELLITLMSSLAQEESRSISENVRWGKRRSFEQGNICLPYKRFLGYRKGEDGLPEIVPEEAEIIRLIFRLTLFGKSPYAIASMLNNEGVPTPGGGKLWRTNNIISILGNEKYRGSARLQKEYTVNFLTKEKRKNNGEVPSYWIEHSHEAIIEPEVFDLVQHEVAMRQNDGRQMGSIHPFSGKIFCSECGGLYGSKVWGSNTQYRRTVWKCNERAERKTACIAPHLTDAQIQTAFLSAFNCLLKNKAGILAAYNDILNLLTDTTALDAEERELKNEIEVVEELARKAIQENAATALDQNDYAARFDSLLERDKAAKSRLKQIATKRLERSAKRGAITAVLQMLKRHDELVPLYNDELWYMTIDRVMVHADGRLLFRFRDGGEVAVPREVWAGK
jgi:DNA invertase Pin-like site-specific DNA recombinase